MSGIKNWLVLAGIAALIVGFGWWFLQDKVPNLHGNPHAPVETPTNPSTSEKPETETPTTNTTEPSKEVSWDAENLGSIRGVVRYEGQAPKRKSVHMSTAECVSLHKEPVLEEKLVVSEQGNLQYSLVYVWKGLPKKSFDVPSTPVVLDQVGCVYLPHVVGIQTGQELQIKNSDPFMHNVLASASKNQPFNEAMNRKGEILTKKFTDAELPVTFQCGVHPWMRSYGGIFKHPFFAVSDANGQFEIKGLPAGEYVLRAWHEAEEIRAQDISVKLEAKETKEITLVFKK